MPRGVWLAPAGAFAGLAALIWLLAFRVDATQWRDGQALYHLERGDDFPVNAVADVLVKFGDPVPFAILAIAIVFVALRRWGMRDAAVVGGGLLLAGSTTQILKHLLEEQRVHSMIRPDDIASTAWPSGHATAAMSLALFAVLVCPPRLRARLAILAIPIAIGTGVSVGILSWHYPSDALGGFSIAAAWACATAGALRSPASARAPTAAPRRRSHPATG